MLIRKENKRGDMSVVLLVLLAVLLTITSLFIFATNTETIQESVSDVRDIDSVYFQENLVKFYFDEAGERALVKTYKEFVDNDRYIDSPIYNSNMDVEFGFLKMNLDEFIRNDFIENLKKEIEKYGFEKEILKELKEVILSEDFEVLVDDEGVGVVLSNFEFKESLEKIDITYTPKLVFEFSYGKSNLDSFNELESVKNNCMIQENIQECFNQNLKNFNAEGMSKEKSGGEGYDLITLTSKKEFLIDSKKERIVFSFVGV